MNSAARIGLVLVAATALLNAQDNPYRTVEGWAKMPEGRTWGSTSAVDIDRDGTRIWVAERCGENSCLNRRRVNLAAAGILKFDADGKLVKSFGAGACSSSRTACTSTATATSG